MRTKSASLSFSRPLTGAATAGKITAPKSTPTTATKAKAVVIIGRVEEDIGIGKLVN